MLFMAAVSVGQLSVMPGLAPGIHVFSASTKKDVGGRDIDGEDALRAFGPAMTQLNF
ncbi:MAG: hypothetical protein KGK16_02325 [Bradyrhizobium sp.]|uniref:hypothetical protein n=1 Tax=Bradyrhizobium sp. TaxID=376 RepID=UPI001EC35D00|nr:hypothetical protein [Bradyrhizobium sp.]MBU6456606.1 hypothetical protein [Bradyrhizobium sp.]MDE2329613.1 hypothetical protein [Bradyrhizobium sp.]MDE2601436.1 hypothetical protein [Bradyrhizobium sp.]